ncbi:MAG: hypothetical protein HOC71_15025 [Candidatus Latescibacteria bacterium]|nr:hypothetical protein [Candidatus Latescibacterota bacterium]
MMRLVKNFPKVYVKVMVGLAILSFVFYFSYLLFYYSGINLDSKIIQIATSLGTASSGSGYRYPLIFHTFVLFENSFFRNSGMFWEPGAFQGYLILALIFLAFVKNDMPRKQYIRYLLILCSAVLSTLSTTGYIALALIPLLHYNWQARQRSRMMFRLAVGLVIILPLLVVGGLYAYRTLPFLGEKIEGQMEQAQYQNRAGWYKGRVGSLVFDWKYIQERPLTGWGLHSVTRHALDPWMQVDDGMGNGMSDFTAKFGITGMLLWLFFVFRGMMYHTERNLQVSLVAVLIICLVLQGEAFLGFPLFLGLAFMGPFKKLYISRHFLTRKTLVKRLAESY